MSVAEDPAWKNLADAAVDALHDQIGRPLTVIVHASDDDPDDFIHSCHVNTSLADVVAAAAHLLEDALALMAEALSESASNAKREMAARVAGALATLDPEFGAEPAMQGRVLQ